MTPPADARLRDDLVQRLRARALIEAPDEHMSIEDIEYPVEVTSGELAEIAALFREAADALAAVSSSQTPHVHSQACFSRQGDHMLLTCGIAAGGSSQMWQPISNAPRDGTYILGFGPLGFMVVAWSDDWTSSKEFRWNDGEYTFDPTHWMPLPAPPASEPTNE